MKELDCLRLFRVLNEHQVRFILIGGMNYYLRYRPVTTQDIDIWIKPESQNSERCECALNSIGAEWGRTDDNWGPTAMKPQGWLSTQSVYCLVTECGMIDVFRSVAGLPDFEDSWDRGETVEFSAGVEYRSLSAQDMISCQLAIPEGSRRIDRMNHLKGLLGT
jgi:hypothetical protein